MLWQEDREKQRVIKQPGTESWMSRGGCSHLVIYKHEESMSKNGVLKCMQILSSYVSLTAPFAAGICSARVDGARVGSAASVRIALISCRAGAHLHEKLTLNLMLSSSLSHRSIAS